MKKIVRIMAVILMAVIVGSQNNGMSLAAEISESKGNTVIDLYEAQIIEQVNLNGEIYSYYYHYDNNRNRVIDITNQRTGEIEILTYLEETGEIFLGDEVLGEVDKAGNSFANIRKAKSDWVKFSSGSQVVSWKKNATVSEVAGLIAIPLASLGVYGVIAAMGSYSISVLANKNFNATVSYTLYKLNTNLIQSWKMEWKVISGGTTYGPYTYVWTN